jgi:SSS family solute:Na+ symporter
MVSFSPSDIFIIILFFAIVAGIGFFASKRSSSNSEDFLLAGRKVGLFLFVLTTVSTWYGGILGIGEFTYRYGLLSWLTQGLPYYIFAILFALFLAKKIRNASLITIPDKLEKVFGKKVALISAGLLFLLVSPAPYLLMIANLLSLVFHFDLLLSLIISFVISSAYLYTGGLKADILTDAFEFFVMYLGFAIIVIIAVINLGDFNFLSARLPSSHLKLTGNASFSYIFVWFFIALWTFTDPGFHQRCYAAKDGNVASKGILISVILWALFDFLTTTTGLYARASLPSLAQPSLSFPLLAEKLLGSGLKGLFYAAMFATIISTLNSFLFLSATTFSKDFLFRFNLVKNQQSLKPYTLIGLTFSGAVSIALAYFIPSVIQLWYSIGTICIPGLILPVVSSYYPRLRIASKLIVLEILTGFFSSITFFLIKYKFHNNPILNNIEPMIIGIISAFLIHFVGLVLVIRRLDIVQQ